MSRRLRERQLEDASMLSDSRPPFWGAVGPVGSLDGPRNRVVPNTNKCNINQATEGLEQYIKVMDVGNSNL